MIKLIKKLIHRCRRLISYGLVGCFNTAVDYGGFTLCYELLGLPAGISQWIGFIMGSCSGYIINSRTTFKEGQGRTKGQFIQYVGVDVVLATVSGLIMAWVEKKGFNAYIAKAVLTVGTGLLHYVIYKYVVFRIKKEDSQDD